jgi:hypothetical protein
MSLAVDLSPADSQTVIYNELIAQGIPPALAVLVTAQSGHETAGWTSHVYLTDNNAFGYGYTGSAYKIYPSVEASADDLAAYLYRRQSDGSFPSLDQITDPAQYAQLLQSAGYYTDAESNYQAGIMNYLNNALESGVALVAANPIPSGMIFVLLIFGYAFFYSRKSKKSTF